MASAEVKHLDLRTPQEHRGFVREDDTRRTGLIVPNDVRAGVLVRDHLGGRHEVGVAAGMVVVMMRVEHVLDRLVGDAPDLLGDEIEAVRELVVDDDHPVVGYPDRNVPTRLPSVEPGDDVEAVHHFTDL